MKRILKIITAATCMVAISALAGPPIDSTRRTYSVGVDILGISSTSASANTPTLGIARTFSALAGKRLQMKNVTKDTSRLYEIRFDASGSEASIWWDNSGTWEFESSLTAAAPVHTFAGSDMYVRVSGEAVTGTTCEVWFAAYNTCRRFYSFYGTPEAINAGSLIGTFYGW